MFAAIYVEFRDRCRDKGLDCEAVIEGWLLDAEEAERAEQQTAGLADDERYDWAASDRLALTLLAATESKGR